MIKRKVFTIIKIAISVIIIALITTVVVLFAIKKEKQIDLRADYDKTRFVSINEVEDLTLNNSRFNFKIDKETTHFTLSDNITAKQFTSVPQEEGLMRDVFEMFTIYSDQLTTVSKEYSVNMLSIKNKDFKYYQADDHIDVLYEVGHKHNILLTDLPLKISADKYQEKIIDVVAPLAQSDFEIRLKLRSFELQYSYLEQEDCYVRTSTISNQEVIDNLYEVIFTLGNYTEEDMQEDAAKFNLEPVAMQPYFEFAIRYKLSDNGLIVTLINDSIYETNKHPFSYIDILPYFGAKNLQPGFTVIPDGSGVLINHENQKYSAATYGKRIYGLDVAKGNYEERISTPSTIKMPMFGYNNGDGSFMAIVSKGEAMSAILAGFQTAREGDLYTTKIPFAYYRYYLREKDEFTFQGQSSQIKQTTYRWTEPYNSDDLIIDYQFLEAGHTYFDIASSYQNYLIEQEVLKPITNLNYKMNYDIIGGVLLDANILGVKTKRLYSLTNYHEINDIIEKSQAEGINNLSINYLGWANDGIKNKTFSKLNYQNKIISKKQLNDLAVSLKGSNIDLNLDVNLSSAYTKRNLNSRDIIKTLYQKHVKRHDYNIATGLYDERSNPKYYLNQIGTSKIIKNLNNKIDENNFGLVISDLGKSLHSDFNGNNIMLKNQMIAHYQNGISNLESFNLSFRDANSYVYKYAKSLLDLPTYQNLLPIIDYSIPFVALVLNGTMDYYNSSINMGDLKSVNFHILKALETGANTTFTISGKTTERLIDSEFSYYFQTYFQNQIPTINKVYQFLSSHNRTALTITNHEIINPQGTKVRVTYSNGDIYLIDYENLSLIVNGSEVILP